MLSGRSFSYSKKKDKTKGNYPKWPLVTCSHLLSPPAISCTTHCHSYTTRCHALSLVVICYYSLYHALILVVTQCHLSSLIVTWCITRLSFYKRSSFAWNFLFQFLGNVKLKNLFSFGLIFFKSEVCKDIF